MSQNGDDLIFAPGLPVTIQYLRMGLLGFYMNLLINTPIKAEQYKEITKE